MYKFSLSSLRSLRPLRFDVVSCRFLFAVSCRLFLAAFCRLLFVVSLSFGLCRLEFPAERASAGAVYPRGSVLRTWPLPGRELRESAD
jgi:hypothetical protein